MIWPEAPRRGETTAQQKKHSQHPVARIRTSWDLLFLISPVSPTERDSGTNTDVKEFASQHFGSWEVTAERVWAKPCFALLGVLLLWMDGYRPVKGARGAQESDQA